MVPEYGSDARISLRLSDSNNKAPQGATAPNDSVKGETSGYLRTWSCRNGLVGQRFDCAHYIRLVRLSGTPFDASPVGHEGLRF
jgi:hypothetical protein